VKLNECFVVGRFKPRRFRAPVVVGWQGEERAVRDATRVELALKKQGDTYSLHVPGDSRLVKLSSELITAAKSGGDIEIVIGWPEPLAIVRRGGTLLYGEGDVVHFGLLDLDGTHSIERVGYQYLADTGSEVKVELALAGDQSTEHTMLDPGQKTTLGPYEIEHDHSFDPSDRPTGAPHHGYFFRVRRTKADAPAARAANVPSPLDVTDPAAIVALARGRSLLHADEALWAEPTEFQKRRDCYEGPQPKLDETMRETGPHPSSLTRHGEVAIVESPRIYRGDHGELKYGRARVELAPTGTVTVTRSQLGTLPGRMRKSAG